MSARGSAAGIHYRPMDCTRPGCTTCALNRRIEKTRLRRRIGRIEARLTYLHRSHLGTTHPETVHTLRCELEALRLKLTQAPNLTPPLIVCPAPLRAAARRRRDG
ncbi:MAG: hypothetical protein ACREV4_03720 [Gammaproteobacteria bacterium]